MVGWLLSLGLLLGVAGPLFGTCTQGSDDPWIASLIVYAPIGIVGVVLAAWTARIGRSFYWLATPHVLTLGLGVYLVPFYFWFTTIGGIDVCSAREGTSFDIAPTLVQRLWAPTWLVLLVILVMVVNSYWRANRVGLAASEARLKS